MLIDFENITEDLTTFEKDEVIRHVVLGFKKKIESGQTGKQHAVDSGRICEGVNRRVSGYTLTPVKLRKMIGAIRQLGLVECLCSSSKGYYVADTMGEMRDTVESLSQRIRQIERVRDALNDQMIINQRKLR